jgi:short-subunit dehydrogenase
MKNINCLVTGASSGIGASIAQELSKSVKHIYILSRNTTELEKINDKIISNGCECTIVPIDLCERNVIENLSEEIFKKDNS